jgi:hypothetical protein
MNAIAKIPGSISPFSGIPVGYGPGGPLPAPTPWTYYGSYLGWNGGLVIGNPTGGNQGPGTVNANAFFTNGQPFSLGGYMPLTGGVISGTLAVNGLATFNGGVSGVVIDMGTF